MVSSDGVDYLLKLVVNGQLRWGRVLIIISGKWSAEMVSTTYYN